jgi:hypothetical protein
MRERALPHRRIKPKENAMPNRPSMPAATAGGADVPQPAPDVVPTPSNPRPAPHTPEPVPPEIDVPLPGTPPDNDPVHSHPGPRVH